ncbi:uncharacterized protein LOC107646639 [Arachis ipaensis]|uniref:uncharacterized protein LOC107646639 n=1 Tax=Arachis ipaensis TaxID=130454 RepID=UPI0007AEF037|nr:uncharacterized protein LOC107646639 [Arachis ipaensis]
MIVPAFAVGATTKSPTSAPFSPSPVSLSDIASLLQHLLFVSGKTPAAFLTPPDDVDGISDLKGSLQRTFDMKDLGSLSYFLGLEVISTNDGIYLSQAKYASDLLARVGITDSCTKSTPLEPNVRFTLMDGTVLDNPTLYRQLVGGLVYLLTVTTRPDIAYSAYSDTDWAGDPTDRHSTTGYCLFLGDSLISWRAKKQTFTARSSTKAEYRALADTTAEVISIRWLLTNLGASQSSPTDLDGSFTLTTFILLDMEI